MPWRNRRRSRRKPALEAADLAYGPLDGTCSDAKV